MKRVLVTGGCGFLGAATIRGLLADPALDSLINFDSLTYAARPDRLLDLMNDPRYRFIQGDVADASQVNHVCQAEGPFDCVLNFAAETHVDRSLHDNKPFIRTNVAGTQVMLDAFRAQNFGKYVQISTDEVYGPVESGVYLREDAPLFPRNPYAATKAAGDHLVLAAFRSFGLDALVVRSVNVYGPSQYPEKFIPLAVTTLQAGGTIPVYGDGRQIRDWLYVDDFVTAVLLVVASGYPGEIYHIAARDERTNLEVAHSIAALMSRSVAKSVRHVDDRPGHDRRYGLDAHKLKSLGWKPQVDFGTGLRRTVEWFAVHPEPPRPAPGRGSRP